jgi:hypothetical protein
MPLSALNALAPTPTQTEPPFAVTQAAVLAIFILIWRKPAVPADASVR